MRIFRTKDYSRFDNATDAIEKINTAGIPKLVELVSYNQPPVYYISRTRSTLVRSFWPLFKRLPAGYMGSVHEDFERRGRDGWLAAYELAHLGPLAESAIPKLMRIAEGSSEFAPPRAFHALGYIVSWRGRGWDTLVRIASTPNHKWRTQACDALNNCKRRTLPQ